LDRLPFLRLALTSVGKGRERHKKGEGKKKEGGKVFEIFGFLIVRRNMRGGKEHGKEKKEGRRGLVRHARSSATLSFSFSSSRIKKEKEAKKRKGGGRKNWEISILWLLSILTASNSSFSI